MEGKCGNHLLLRPERHNKQMHPMNLNGSWFQKVEGTAIKDILGTPWEIKYRLHIRWRGRMIVVMVTQKTLLPRGVFKGKPACCLQLYFQGGPKK